jgi:hypothetical protein
VNYQSFCNTKQLLEAAEKSIYITHLKAFLFKLDNVSLLKYMYTIVLSQVIAHDAQPGFL